ncbi:MAG: hypothetical protein ACXW1W_04710 [Methylococcaceae bacterium]
MNSSHRRISLIFLLSIQFASPSTWAAPVKLPESFPMPMTFRAFDGIKHNSDAFKKRLEEQAPYPFIHAPGDDKKANAINARWPDKIITLQGAYGGISENDFADVWPGHLLYKQGTLISQDISPQDNVIAVRNAGLIAKNNKSIQRMSKAFPTALTIYALDPSGTPDWSQAEHVILESVGNKGITVQRGQWGTKPLSFKAGKAVAAPHMMYWTKQWQLNFSLHSPRGGRDNLTAAEWFARKTTQKVSEANVSGIEFDVARWTWGFPVANPMDINNDLVADYGYIDGVNSFGLGGRVFFRELRKLLGPDKIIQADSNDAQLGIRGWQYLNGVQMESFPVSNDFDRFSQAFNHFRLWVDNAEALPHLSYPFTKTPTTVFANDHLPDGSNTDFRFRVGFASACLMGMPHPFANLDNINFDPANAKIGGDEKSEHFGVFHWDEYYGGNLNNWQWLGRPIGTAQQDLSNLNKADLLSGVDWKWSISKDFSAEQTQAANVFSANVQRIPNGILPEKMLYGVHLAPKGGGLRTLKPGQEYTLEFEARGEDNWHYAGQNFERVPRMIAISGADAASKRKQPLSVLADGKFRSYRISFIADGSPTPVFGVSEQIGTTEIRNIKLYSGGAERWSREFENGMVLLNMTNQPWRASIKKGYYRRLKGDQAPAVNNGQAVENEVIVPARDALFLVKR